MSSGIVASQTLSHKVTETRTDYRVAQFAQQAVCEAQEILERFSQQIYFGVLKLASAFNRTPGSTVCAASCVRSTGNP